MIEVNLHPDSRKRGPRGRKWSFSLPEVRGLSADRWTLGAVATSLLALAVIGFLFTRVAGVVEELEIQVAEAAEDSVRFADVIASAEGLRARSDSIAERVAVIQEIDGARYLWPHLMNEVGRALPDFTWLTRFAQISSGPELMFRIDGQAGTYFALTSFMENLEASPFIRNVRLIVSDQVTVTGPRGALPVYDFVLEAQRREPPPELLETVPLFGASVRPPEEVPDAEGGFAQGGVPWL